MDVHMICLIGETTLYCVLVFFYFEISSSSLLIRARSTWRCLRSSSIFKSSMMSSISAGSRLWWTSSLPRARWRKHYSGGRKSLKTWSKKLGKSWMRKPWQLFNFAWRTKCWMNFLRRNQHSRC